MLIPWCQRVTLALLLGCHGRSIIMWCCGRRTWWFFIYSTSTQSCSRRLSLGDQLTPTYHTHVLVCDSEEGEYCFSKTLEFWQQTTPQMLWERCLLCVVVPEQIWTATRILHHLYSVTFVLKRPKQCRVWMAAAISVCPCTLTPEKLFTLIIVLGTKTNRLLMSITNIKQV